MQNIAQIENSLTKSGIISDNSKSLQSRFVRELCVLAITSLFTFFLWAFLFAPQAQAMGLKENVILDDSFIKLGDIFYDLPRDHQKILGAAPRPGSEIVLNARTLMRVAIALDLPWRPTSSNDYVVLRRSATLIDHKMIEKGLINAVREKGFNGKFTVNFDRSAAEMILPESYGTEFEIVTIDIDFKTDRFTAHIAAPSKDNPIHTNIIKAKIERLVSVPVLREASRNGRILNKHDIEFIDIPEHEVNHDVVLDAQELLGMTPRRMLMASKPITSKEIEAPMIVRRGEIVTMIFENGPLFLTAQGRALQNGAKGEIIRVSSDNSSRTIQAQISDTREVRVVTQ